MSRIHVIFGLLIIAALITAGCTGTKTMVGTGLNSPSAGQSAAKSDYTTNAGVLSDEINYLKNFYKPSNTSTLDDYNVWLDGFKDRLALCRQMYNNTSAAAERYLGYLNTTSDDYKNVTDQDAGFLSDIESLNLSYGQYADYLNTSVKKMAAFEDYKAKLNASTDKYNDLAAFAKGAKVDSVDAYSQFIDGFGSKAGAFENAVNAAVKAGDTYAGYYDPNSSEYKAIKDNDDSLKSNVQKCWETYNNYKKDYDSKMGARDAAQSTFKDYVDKIGKAGAAKKDLDSYDGTAKALDKLNAGWLAGYKQRMDAFDSACNDAIASGQACKQYLDASSKDYKGVDTNEKNMKDSMAAYSASYTKMNNMYRNLHPLGTIK